MLRIHIAAMPLALIVPVTMALTTGNAAAQAVPGAADVGEYHERYAVDANPYERSPHAGFLLEEALTGGRPAPDAFVLEETVIMSPVPAAIPGPAPAVGQSAATGLTPGVPLGTSDISDRKVVAGQAR
jgi:hypothetical protein